jgi:hypothetical protein
LKEGVPTDLKAKVASSEERVDWVRVGLLESALPQLSNVIAENLDDQSVVWLPR